MLQSGPSALSEWPLSPLPSWSPPHNQSSNPPQQGHHRQQHLPQQQLPLQLQSDDWDSRQHRQYTPQQHHHHLPPRHLHQLPQPLFHPRSRPLSDTDDSEQQLQQLHQAQQPFPQNGRPLMHTRSPTRVLQPLERSYQQPERRARLNHQHPAIQPHSPIVPLMSIQTTRSHEQHAAPDHADHHFDGLSDTNLCHRLSNQSW